MNQQTLKEIENKLIKEKELIEENLKQLASQLDFGDDIDEGEEEADESEETGNFLSVKTNQEQRLQQIANALQRIHDETYGICEQCGREIESEVIEAAPESELCKKCKETKRM